MREAEDIDRKIEQNEELGPLAGVPIAVKDNICTADMPSTGGSRILEGYRPAVDATAVRRLRECGGIVIGKTNLDEFGMGSTTEASGFQVRVYHLFIFTLQSNPIQLSKAAVVRYDIIVSGTRPNFMLSFQSNCKFLSPCFGSHVKLCHTHL